MYAAAASLALIFGVTFIYNSNNDSGDKNLNSKEIYANHKGESKTEAEMAYETLKSDLTSVENNNQIVVNQKNNTSLPSEVEGRNEKKPFHQNCETCYQKEEARMNEYLDSFSNSEIAELASNSTQDVYLDLYN